jgi:transposase InsO family protein
MHEFVRDHPRYGYRRVAALLRPDGFRANDKRVYRLGKREGFKVQKNGAKAASGHVIKRRDAALGEGIGRIPGVGFVPRQAGGWRFGEVPERYRQIYTGVLVPEPRRLIKAKDAAAMLAWVIEERDAPKRLRSDNGPEFIAAALYIAPGSPWQNRFGESYNARVKDELIGVELFPSMKEAQVVGGDWREAYNKKRPHLALGYLTPAAFVATRLLLKETGGEAAPASRQGLLFVQIWERISTRRL